ncbi:MAG: adenosylcobinamide-GDP ribazoletransferase [Betaproteobacteria bacterium HGW-Betaproteobacteria-6]|jgi:adenosylcobinamide-GDP ribazoletransferase|nr:MAG: adenosylcobinamide-GDP ribazoletransferase [Betaproteobacteria bacterium HGW-Betaproteobacteria-6]
MIRRELATFLAALGYFTRLPVPGWVGYSPDRLARAARYLPAIGLLVGGVGALVFWLALHVWPQPVAVVLAMVASIALTGAFHEDGLSDTADGLGGGWDKAKILAIMKDSRVGSYGVIAVVLALLGKFALLSTLPAGQVVAALIAGHAVSRFCAVSLMAGMDYARDDESSKARPVAARLGLGPLLFALAFAGLPLVLLVPEQALAAVVLAALATFWLAAQCRRWLGGYTGDCLGAVQQLAEIAFYLGLAAHF